MSWFWNTDLPQGFLRSGPFGTNTMWIRSLSTSSRHTHTFCVCVSPATGILGFGVLFFARVAENNHWLTWQKCMHLQPASDAVQRSIWTLGGMAIGCAANFVAGQRGYPVRCFFSRESDSSLFCIWNKIQVPYFRSRNKSSAFGTRSNVVFVLCDCGQGRRKAVSFFSVVNASFRRIRAQLA